MNTIDGPFLPPRSGTAKQMVIFLHGYGSNGDDLLSIGEEWAHMLPDTVFLSPNAPTVCEMWAAGYQWFSLRAAEGISAGAFSRDDMIKEPASILNAYIDAQLAAWNVDASALAVVGFSQGAMMAMYTMPRRAKACAGVIGYSGLLVAAEGLKGADIVKPPILAIHGAVDEVVSPNCLNGVADGFEAAGFDVETILRPGLGHGIDPFGLKRGLDFLRTSFGLDA